MAHCETEFRLAKPLPDGGSQRLHLEAVYRATGKMPATLAEIPPMPDELAYLWHWFLDLDAARGSNGFGISPLSYVEIKAWSDLTRNTLAPWEIEAIKRLDAVRIRVVNEK